MSSRFSRQEPQFRIVEHPETDPDFCGDLLLTEGNQV